MTMRLSSPRVEALPVFDVESGTLRMDLRMCESEPEPEPELGTIETDCDIDTVPRPQPTVELLSSAVFEERAPTTLFKESFSITISHNTFDGWVHQPSPCCGAASVAGAVNAVLGLPHDAPEALNHAHVASIYHCLLVRETSLNPCPLYCRSLHP